MSRPSPMSAETSAKIDAVVGKVTSVIPDSFANAGESLDAAITRGAMAIKDAIAKAR